MYRALPSLLLIVAFAVGCDDRPPSAPTPQAVNLSGTWSGDVSAQGTSARMVWTLSQTNATDVSGPVLLALPTGVVLFNGFLTGTLAGTTLTYTISVGPGGIPASPSCVGQLGGTMTATMGITSTLTGDFAIRSTTCAAPFGGGNLTLTRQ